MISKQAIVTPVTPEQEELPVIELPGIVETPVNENVPDQKQPVPGDIE